MSTKSAKALRSASTDTERLLWNCLKGRQLGGFKFRRQVQIDSYIVDFVCYDKKLVVEVDGGQHATRKDYDSQRTAYLESQGFTVLRFWDSEVLKEMEAVKAAIYSKLQTL